MRPRRGSSGSRARRRPTSVSRRSRSPARARRARAAARRRPHLPGVGRLDEREPLDVAEAERGHLQDHRGEVGAQDLRLGELRPGEEVLLGVEADRDAVGHAAAAAAALVGARLRDRLDGQPLDLQPRGVARDAGRARVDDVPDARHRQRGLGDVGGEHHAAPLCASNTRCCSWRGEPGVEREDLGVAQLQPAQGVGGVADLALAREEHEHVARALACSTIDGVADRRDLVAVVAVLHAVRLVHDVDRVGAPAHLDDGRSAEVLAEPRGVDRGRGDDDLEVRAPRQDLAAGSRGGSRW